MAEKKSNPLRDKVLAADPSYRKAHFKFDGVEYEVREMSLSQTRDLDTRAKDKKGRVDPYRAMVLATITSVFVPGTDEHAFEPGDESALMRLPSNSGFFAAFGKALEQLKPASVEELEGN